MSFSLSIVEIRANWRHWLFEAGILGKGINATLEILSGFLLIILGNEKLSKLVAALTYEELSEDPRDKFANYLLHSSQNLTVSGLHFNEIYLLTHGIIKIFLIIALFRKKLFAYPAAMLVFSVFVIYQLYRFSYSGSVLMLVFSVVDILVIILTYFEYKRLSSSKN